jgi:hypothetical protein
LLFGGEIESGGFFDSIVVLLHALLLQAAEFGDFLFAAASEARFLAL